MANIETKERILGNIVTAVNKLEKCADFTLLIPEVRVNLAYALPRAATRRHVAAIDGRITAVRGMPRASGFPVFGASDHMARLIIEIRKYDPIINAGINFRYNEIIEEIARKYCEEHQWLFGWIDRRDEPADVIEKDGASMPWKIKDLVTRSNGTPRLFFEGDGWGKEPLFVATGADAVEVTDIAIEIAHRYGKKIRNVS